MLGRDQWNGVAIVSRVGLEDVERASRACRSTATRLVRRGRVAASAPRATGTGCRRFRAQRARPSGIRTRRTSWPGRGPARDGVRLAANASHRQAALTGDSNIAPRDEDVFDVGAVREEFDARHAAASVRLSRGSSTPATRRSCARSIRDRRSTPTGTTTVSASSATAACGSTSCSARRRWPPGSPARSSSAEREPPGTGACDHAPVVVDLSD